MLSSSSLSLTSRLRLSSSPSGSSNSTTSKNTSITSMKKVVSSAANTFKGHETPQQSKTTLNTSSTNNNNDKKSNSFMKNDKTRRNQSIRKYETNDNSSSSTSSLPLAAQSPSIAIIGGGISGLSCALHLLQTQQQQQQQQQQQGQEISPAALKVTVFDTGRLLPGGRCSSRFSQKNNFRSSISNKKNSMKSNNNKNRDSILSSYTIDHAAQMLVLPREGSGLCSEFKEFQSQVLKWEKENVLRRFAKNSVVEIVSKDNVKSGSNSNRNSNNSGSTTNNIQIHSLNSTNMFYATHGMGSIPLTMMKSANNLHVEQDVWISPSNGVQYVGTTSSAPTEEASCPKWSIQSNGKRLGVYDYVVVAHNGKCADRLMSRSPAKDLHSLLRVDFRSNVPEWGGKKMTLNSIYSLTVALQFSSGSSSSSDNGDDDANDEQIKKLSNVVGEDVIVAFVKNEPNLKMITNQSKKFAHLKEQGLNSSSKDKMEVWTIFSSASFAKKYKGPQENLPEETVEQVTALLLASLERSLGLEEGTLHNGVVKDSRLQLWGAAVPLNVWSPDNAHKGKESDCNAYGFLYDAEHGVGACGDWLLDPSIAGAWESGRRLAHWILNGVEQKKDDFSSPTSSVGLPAQGGFAFQKSRAACNSGIGNIR